MKKVLSILSAITGLILLGLVSWTIAYNNRERLGDRDLRWIAADEAARSQIGSIKYGTADDLIAANPGCCMVLHSRHEWLQAQLIEQDASVVLVSFMVENTPEKSYHSMQYLIDASGKIIESTGIDEKSPAKY